MPVPGFSSEAIITWSKGRLSPGCLHIPTVVGRRKPDELPKFRWVSTVLGNAKTSLSGAYHAFYFGKYVGRNLAAIAYRFNSRFRFQLKTLPERLLTAAVSTGTRPEAWLRMAEDCC